MATTKKLAPPVKKAAPKKAAKKAAPKKAIKSNEPDLNVVLTEERIKDVLDEVTHLTVELDTQCKKNDDLGVENSKLSQKAFRHESEVNDLKIELTNIKTLYETSERMRNILANQNDDLNKGCKEMDSLYKDSVNRISNLELILDAKKIELEELKHQFEQVNNMLDNTISKNAALQRKNKDLEDKWYNRLFRKLG